MSREADNTASSSSRNVEAPAVPITLRKDLEHDGGENLTPGADADSEKRIDDPNICLFASRTVRFEFPRDLLHKVPYLETALSGRFAQVQDDGGVIQLDELNPAVLRPILDYVRTGRARHLFAHLSRKESVAELLETLDFLCVRAPAAKSLNLLQTELTGCFTERQIKGARDAAFLFGMSLQLGQYGLDDQAIRNNIFMKLEFIFSHPSTFHRRMRAHVYEVYNQKVKDRLTKKQNKVLEESYAKLAVSEGASDETDEDESSVESSSIKVDKKALYRPRRLYDYDDDLFGINSWGDYDSDGSHSPYSRSSSWWDDIGICSPPPFSP